jgi:sugar lactone lactonase YvrE
VKRIGRLGSAPGELYRPTDFALCPDGTIWIAERGNGRLEKFSPDGKVQQKIDTAEPVSIAIGPEGSLAVVGARDADLVKLYRAGGQYLRSAGEYVDVPGATDFQKRSFNKGRVFAMPEGFVYMYSFVAESLMRQYTWAGALIREWRPDGFGMDNARTKAKARQAGSIASGGSGARSMLNGLDVDEKRRAIWIAPAASALYVYGYDGAKLAEHRLQDSGGQTYGAHDVAISPDSKTLTFVSGAFLMQTSLSDALNGKGVDR